MANVSWLSFTTRVSFNGPTSYPPAITVFFRLNDLLQGSRISLLASDTGFGCESKFFGVNFDSKQVVQIQQLEVTVTQIRSESHSKSGTPKLKSLLYNNSQRHYGWSHEGENPRFTPSWFFFKRRKCEQKRRPEMKIGLFLNDNT